MRVHKLMHQVVMRFSAMDESEALELWTEADKDYKEAVDQAKAKKRWNAQRLVDIANNKDKPDYKPVAEQVLTVQDKMVMLAEKWYARYGFAIAYIVMVPMIRDYMNGDQDGQREMDEDEEMLMMMKMMRNMKRYQKN